LPRGYSCLGKPQYLSVECHKQLNSITFHFTSAVPLFVASYIFAARLSRCKTFTR
jgi:hypothetical protein